MRWCIIRGGLIIGTTSDGNRSNHAEEVKSPSNLTSNIYPHQSPRTSYFFYHDTQIVKKENGKYLRTFQTALLLVRRLLFRLSGIKENC